MIRRVIEWVKDEPVIVADATTALIALAVSFGIDITPEQKTSIIGVVWAVLSLVARSKVRPERDVKKRFKLKDGIRDF